MIMLQLQKNLSLQSRKKLSNCRVTRAPCMCLPAKPRIALFTEFSCLGTHTEPTGCLLVRLSAKKPCAAAKDRRTEPSPELYPVFELMLSLLCFFCDVAHHRVFLDLLLLLAVVCLNNHNPLCSSYMIIALSP
jgi:hypothetical protein